MGKRKVLQADKPAKHADIVAGLVKLVEQGELVRAESGAMEILGKETSAKHPDDPRFRVEVTNVLGGIATYRGDFQAALDYFSTCLADSELVGYRNGIASALHNIGVTHVRLGNYALGLQYLEKALALDEELGRKRSIAREYSEMGTGSVGLGKFAQALEYYEHSLRICRELGDDSGIANAYCGMANAYVAQSEYAQAVYFYEQALAVYRAIGQQNGTALTLGNLAYAHFRIGNYAAALERWERALELDTEAGNTVGMAKQLGGIGNIYSKQNNMEQALEWYERSLQMFRLCGSKPGIAGALSNIARTHKVLQNYEQSLKYLEQALQLHEEDGEQREISHTLGHIGIVHKNMHDYDTALEYLQRGVEVFRQLGIIRGAGAHLTNIGAVYAMPDYEHRNLTVAEKYIRDALAEFEETGEKHPQYLLHQKLAGLCREQKRFEEANEHLLKFYELKEQIFNEEQRKAVENFNIRLAIAEKEREMQEQKLKAEFLEKEMKRQQDELTNKALQLVKQTDMLENFRHNLEGIVRKTDDAGKIIKEVKQCLKDLPEEMLNWNKFHDDFHAAHPDFEKKLKLRFPTLTAMEIKVCYLLRIGMNSREISTLLFLSERTVAIHRGHIRKKFGITDRNADIRAVLEGL